MKTSNILAALALTMCAGLAQAAVSEEEAKQLGATLTPFGAEKAGNKEGTIPPYTGGLTTPPANYQKGSGWRPDPFPQDKPLFSINAKNMDKYADKLTEGAKELMKKYPDYRIDVYPSRRTIAYPKPVLDNTVKNATRCNTVEGGLLVDQGCIGGIPFPIPTDGYQAMWNHLLNYRPVSREAQFQVWFVDASGRPVLTNDSKLVTELPYYDSGEKYSGLYYRLRNEQSLPARGAGVNTLIADYTSDIGRRAWVYSPGQRRVRLAPDVAYDTPSDSTGGAMHFDMVNIFSGKMDRFDFKLVGKKEIYMPYNNYKLVFETNPQDTLGKNYVKPELVRWELHRMWVVEATLKQGKRHVFKKWTFYWDEDNAGYGMSDAWDANGKLYKSSMTLNVQLYDATAPNADGVLIYDFNNGIYALTAVPTPGGIGIVPSSRKPSSFYNPESLAGSGVR